MKQKFSWTKEKEEKLKKLWNTIPLYKIAKEFQTTEEIIIAKAKELKLGEYKSNRWTKEEEALLREYSKKYVTKTIAKKLGRSYLAVQKKAIKLGLELHSSPDPWKKWMIDYLKDNINKQPIGQIQTMLGLSYHCIITKCKELGIEYVKETWTEEEINLLREFADKCHFTELTKVLPNRSVGAISAKAYELGIRTISNYTKLSDDDIKYIKDNWGKIPATEIARNLKITIGVLNRYKKELNLPNTGQQVKWTEDVIAKIRKDAKTMNRNELATKYKTSVQQISRIAELNNIKLINSRIFWTEELINELKKCLKEGLDVFEIAKKMDISTAKVRNQVNVIKNGETNQSNQRRNSVWSKQEVDKLIELAATHTSKEIARGLGKKTSQVSSKARKLGINIKKEECWSSEDIESLLNLYKENEVNVLIDILQKSESSIREKAQELGITLKYKPPVRWTKEEENLLKVYVNKYTNKEIAKILNRTESSVASKLNYMGLRALKSSWFWTEEEEKTLQNLATKHNVDEIALLMNKSYEAIVNKMYELGIKKVLTSNKRWTKEEESYLLELLTSFSNFEVAEILGRSEEAISRKAASLGYKINEKHRKWTKEDEVLLMDLWGIKPIEIIAKKLNRTVSSIVNRVYKLGLSSQIESNYDGLTIQDVSDMFKVNRNIILTTWVSLGLELNFRKRSDYSRYAYVTIDNLYKFLRINSNIWDSSVLDLNTFGVEPAWLKEKREMDKKSNPSLEKLNLLKQKLILAKKYYLSDGDEDLNQEEGAKLVRKNNLGDNK